jgi:hypothetical protein
MKNIQLTASNLMPGAEALRETFLGRQHYDRLVRDEPTTVLKPDGEVLLVYVPDAISTDLGTLGYRAFRSLPSDSHNRHDAAGGKPTSTGIAGYFRGDAREPSCRLTKFTAEHSGAFRRALPFVQRASSVFEQYAPDRYAAQKAFIDTVSPDFRIANTAFTTFTVNKNWPTAAHTDSGDFKDGFGVLTVVRRGRFRGGELVFPKYRTAVDIGTGGVLLADVHELHGNAAIIGEPNTYTRLSFIFYAREDMDRCGSRREEFERARRVT